VSLLPSSTPASAGAEIERCDRLRASVNVVPRITLSVVVLPASSSRPRTAISAAASGVRAKAGTLSGSFSMAMPLIHSWPVAPQAANLNKMSKAHEIRLKRPTLPACMVRRGSVGLATTRLGAQVAATMMRRSRLI